MRIGIDGTALYGRYNGVEYSLWNLLGALSELDSDNYYTIFVPRDGPLAAEREKFGANFSFIAQSFRGAEKARRIAWQHASLPRLLRRGGFDLLHAPTYVAPLRCPVPVVLTVHDLIALTHPDLATAANRLHYGVALRPSIASARRILVPSEAVQREVVRLCPGAPANIGIVPWGVEPAFFAPHSADDVGAVRSRYSLPEKYLLYVGNFEPKKNLTRLLAAHQRLASAPPLVLAGGARAWRSAEVQSGGRSIGIGYVPRADLPALFAGCQAFLFPSLAEGFGLPVVEALAAGAAVVTSTAVPLPGLDAAAELCDPLDIASIASAIERIISDEAHRDDLRRRARAYAAPFTWRRTAELTLAAYREALS